jgi:hypothetical protein
MSKIIVVKMLTLLMIMFIFIFSVSYFLPGYLYGVGPSISLKDYYKILKNQELVLVGEEISSQQEKTLKNCGDDYKCFLKFYENFNASTTLEKTFSNLNLLLKTHPEYTDYCHQITHGIGHSEYVKNKGDMAKSLEEFNVGKFMKNIATCGSGYFHGLLEKAVDGKTNKEELVKYFNSICNQTLIKEVVGSDCIHGLGHASLIQLDYNLEEGIYVCDKVIKTDPERFNCLTGIFMEYVLVAPFEQVVKVNEDKISFPVCDLQVDLLSMHACYFETAMRLRDLIKNKNDYSEMTALCQKVPDSLNRLACVKNVAIRSIIDVNYQNITKMCLQNTVTKQERIFCVTNFAHRIALSIYGHRGIPIPKHHK